AHSLKKQNRRSFVEGRKKTKVPPSFNEVLSFIPQMRVAIIQRHQELELNRAIESEITASASFLKRPSEPLDDKGSKAIYEEVCSSIIQKSQLLLHILPAPGQPVAGHEIISFVMSSVAVERIKNLLLIRRVRAIWRARGFQFMRKIIYSANYSTMRHEAL